MIVLDMRREKGTRKIKVVEIDEFKVHVIGL